VNTETTTGTFVRVWAALMLLALASFGLSFLHLGSWAPIVALGIGLAKAILIAGFFMHLAEQPPISRWAFGLGIALALLLLVMVGLDVLTRETSGLRQPGMDAPPAASDDSR
jgi:cytochrome c oxidase subunit 4